MPTIGSLFAVQSTQVQVHEYLGLFAPFRLWGDYVSGLQLPSRGLRLGPFRALSRTLDSFDVAFRDAKQDRPSCQLVAERDWRMPCNNWHRSNKITVSSRHAHIDEGPIVRALLFRRCGQNSEGSPVDTTTRAQRAKRAQTAQKEKRALKDIGVLLGHRRMRAPARQCSFVSDPSMLSQKRGDVTSAKLALSLILGRFPARMSI